MNSVNPKLLIVLGVVIALAVFVKVMNPYKKYSRQDYWKTATVEDVKNVPAKALKPGNKNGPVLMWAAMATKDPQVLSALVARGALVDEPDIVFKGTPLSAAASYATNPEIIDELIRLGADINKEVGQHNKTALMISAELNFTPGIIDRLLFYGADVNKKDLSGETALDLAKMNKNSVATAALEKHAASPASDNFLRR